MRKGRSPSRKIPAVRVGGSPNPCAPALGNRRNPSGPPLGSAGVSPAPSLGRAPQTPRWSSAVRRRAKQAGGRGRTPRRRNTNGTGGWDCRIPSRAGQCLKSRVGEDGPTMGRADVCALRKSAVRKTDSVHKVQSFAPGPVSKVTAQTGVGRSLGAIRRARGARAGRLRRAPALRKNINGRAGGTTKTRAAPPRSESPNHLDDHCVETLSPA